MEITGSFRQIFREYRTPNQLTSQTGGNRFRYTERKTSTPYSIKNNSELTKPIKKLLSDLQKSIKRSEITTKQIPEFDSTEHSCGEVRIS